jgi:hypothetical protein
MSVIVKIRTARLQLTPTLETAKSSQSKALGFVRGPNLIVVLGFPVVGLLVSVLFLLSAKTAIQLSQML